MARKLIFVSLLVCTLFVSLFLITDCTKVSNRPFATNLIKYNKVEKVAKCNFIVDYPIKGNEALLQSAREWISEQFGGTYKGSYLQGDSLLLYYGKAAMDTLNAYETNKFVTYEATSYSYLGGAHGGATLEGVTFRKSDGRKFGWEMFTRESRFTILQGLIKDGLKQYFKVKTDEELKANFLNPDNIYMIPLPQALPYFTKEGVKFVYAQYEIASYAAGMPSFTVPYDKIKPLLTAPAVDLF
jgi:hypothetical protein